MASFSGLQPWLREHAKALAAAFPGLTLTSTYRSKTAQRKLYANRKNNPYPVAPPGSSYHEYGRAFDLVGPLETLRAAGALWLSWGGTWSMKDSIHFQA